MRTTRNRVSWEQLRGFESHSLRHQGTTERKYSVCAFFCVKNRFFLKNSFDFLLFVLSDASKNEFLWIRSALSYFSFTQL